MMLQRRLPIVGMSAQNRGTGMPPPAAMLAWTLTPSPSPSPFTPNPYPSPGMPACRDAGMDDFLTFPVDRENLLLKVLALPPTPLPLALTLMLLLKVPRWIDPDPNPNPNPNPIP